MAEGYKSSQDWMLEQLLDDGPPLILGGELDPTSDDTDPATHTGIVQEITARTLDVRRVLVKAWPMLAVVFGIVGGVWLRERSRGAPPLRLRLPAGWALVPMRMETPGQYPRRHHPVIDGVVITGGGLHG
jgi:hypothetical protein